MSYQETFNDVINTNLTKLPDTPQIKITNPLKKKIYVNSIQLSFDAYFSDKGVVMIKINGNVVLNKNIAGAYSRLQNLPVNLKNQEFNQQGKIEIFVCNGLDTDFVSLGYTIQISEDPNAQIPSNVPLSLQERNNQLSDPKEVFEFKTYYNEIATQLINTNGFKRFWAILSAQDYDSPTIITNDTPFTNPQKAVNGILGDATDQFQYWDFYPAGALPVTNFIVDFGSIASRIPKASMKTKVQDLQAPPDADCSVTTKFFVSNNGADWTEIDSFTRISNGSTEFIDTFTLEDVEQEFRYLKLEFSGTRGTDRVLQYFQIFEIYDAYKVGGTASLSFELRDSLGNWHEIIPSSEFGTVTIGQSQVAQIGDTLTKKYAIPSTQTHFRAKLTVTGGGIKTGVSIIKVA